MPPMPDLLPVGAFTFWDLFAPFTDMFTYHFMQNAFLAGTIVAIVAGCVGYFMVLRAESFAGHTLANVGFAGAAGAVLVAAPPVAGLLVFGVLGALGIGALGERSARARGRYDIAIGTLLALALGLGLLFERLSPKVSVTEVYAILFGGVLGVRDGDVATVALTAVVALGVLLVIGRPLLFASLDPEVANARGVPVRALSFAFLLLLALAVTQAVQVVGVLLIFSLLVSPAAAASWLTARPGRAIALSVAIALVVTWAGLTVAYYTPYPVGFFISTFAFAAYLLARLVGARARTRRPGVTQPKVEVSA